MEESKVLSYYGFGSAGGPADMAVIFGEVDDSTMDKVRRHFGSADPGGDGVLKTNLNHAQYFGIKSIFAVSLRRQAVAVPPGGVPRRGSPAPGDAAGASRFHVPDQSIQPYAGKIYLTKLFFPVAKVTKLLLIFNIKPPLYCRFPWSVSAWSWTGGAW